MKKFNKFIGIWQKILIFLLYYIPLISSSVTCTSKWKPEISILFSLLLLFQRNLLECRRQNSLVVNIATVSEENHFQDDSTMKNKPLGVFNVDPLLKPYADHLNYRYDQYTKIKENIEKYEGGLDKFSSGRSHLLQNSYSRSIYMLIVLYNIPTFRMYYHGW